MATAAQWQPPRAIAPLLWMVREALTRRAEIGQVYCPVVPVM